MNAPTQEAPPTRPTAKRIYEVRRVWDEIVLGTRVTSEPEYDWLDAWLQTFENEEPLDDLMYCSTAVRNGRRTWWRRADGHAEKCETCDGAGTYCRSQSRATGEFYHDDCETCEGSGWIAGPLPASLDKPHRGNSGIEAKRKLKLYAAQRAKLCLPAAAE